MSQSTEVTDNQKALLRLQTMIAVLDRARNLELARIGSPYAQTTSHCLCPGASLERQGLVTTERNMERKNWVRVSLTKRGEQAIEGWVTATTVPDVMDSLQNIISKVKRANEALETLH